MQEEEEEEKEDQAEKRGKRRSRIRMGKRGREETTLTTQILILSLCSFSVITTRNLEALSDRQTIFFNRKLTLESEQFVISRLQFAILKKFFGLIVYTRGCHTFPLKRWIHILGFSGLKISVTTIPLNHCKAKAAKPRNK